MMIGSVAGYWLGVRAGGGVAARFLGEKEMARMTAASGRFGDWIIVLFRAVPVLAEASVFFAGLTRMPFRRFCMLAALSNLGISVVYAAVGAMSVKAESFYIAFAAAVVLPGIAMLASRANR